MNAVRQKKTKMYAKWHAELGKKFDLQPQEVMAIRSMLLGEKLSIEDAVLALGAKIADRQRQIDDLQKNIQKNIAIGNWLQTATQEDIKMITSSPKGSFFKNTRRFV